MPVPNFREACSRVALARARFFRELVNMKQAPNKTMRPGRPPGPSLFGLLKPYGRLVFLLVILTILGNSLNLVVPTLISHAIDNYSQQLIIEFLFVAAGIFVFAYLQAVSPTHPARRGAPELPTP